jgi:heat-inducible transcriptional repressor
MAEPDDLLDLRARRLLRALIHRHVSDGAPVGSRTLSQIAGLDLSPASIRSILAELEKQGLVAAPHTSAGRVPTPRGYRLYVDSLLELDPLAERERERLRHGLAEGAGEGGVLGRASELLSAMSRMVGVVGVPSRARLPLKHIEFVSLDAGRVLVVLVLGDDSVQNRILEVGGVPDPGLLERAANYLNQAFAGFDLGLIRERLVQELRLAQGEMERLLRQAMTLTEGTLSAVPADVVLAGQSQLIGVSDLSDMQRLRELFEAFAGKRDILQLLERTIRAPGVRVFIGEETGLAPMEGMSLVTASYASSGRILGVLGVLGPSRMAYERVIPLVSAAADAVGAALASPRPQ